MQFERQSYAFIDATFAAPLVKILPIHFENVLPYNGIDIIDHLLVSVANLS